MKDIILYCVYLCDLLISEALRAKAHLLYPGTHDDFPTGVSVTYLSAAITAPMAIITAPDQTLSCGTTVAKLKVCKTPPIATTNANPNVLNPFILRSCPMFDFCEDKVLHHPEVIWMSASVFGGYHRSLLGVSGDVPRVTQSTSI